MAGYPKLLCLLPVRNGARWLSGYIRNTRKFADGIIALDDGSSDQTRALLAKDRHVKRILAHPPRASYAGWDDRLNRTELLEACGEFSPEWVFWLDADELLADSDIALLLKFLKHDANSRFAYGFEVLRMIGNLRHFDLHHLWAFRLFAFRSNYTLPNAMLHFEPVPKEIPPSAWKRTRLRILHRSGMTPALRKARYAKYLEADPRNAWQASYANLLETPEHLWELRRLPPHASVLLE